MVRDMEFAASTSSVVMSSFSIGNELNMVDNDDREAFENVIKQFKKKLQKSEIKITEQEQEMSKMLDERA